MESCKLRYFNSFEFFDHTSSVSGKQASAIAKSKLIVVDVRAKSKNEVV